ncbi:MAG TPA: hypothetical protein VL547_00605 [Dinghuibacter sp.]|uniref:hypothetical protein n=1 Tax=Dinghuibacter sp. TaxID=2024697 RepID=UPI002CCB6F29|nr:hypothetical protein [Dinghuibacter sp.]HTJ10488.1 hypothetical protein [Dinghuibacter sp.]
MSDYRQLETELAQDLVTSIGGAAAPPVKALVDALVDAIPYFGDPGWLKAHRDALVNLLAAKLPTSVIVPHPSEFHNLDHYVYTYDGPYPGYREVFYPGIKPSLAATAVAERVKTVDPGLDDAWWGRYGVMVLTDAIHTKVNLPVNTARLSEDLLLYAASFKPAFAASYLAIFLQVYPPSVAALSAIAERLSQAEAQSILHTAIASGQFTAAVNLMLSLGGTTTTAATWFLFNLWMCLKALGMMDVDAAIRYYIGQGLAVPAQVGPGQWWSGGYTSWFEPLGGSDVVIMAGAGITAGFPEIEQQSHGRFAPTRKHITVANGYSESYCYWGACNWYK